MDELRDARPGAARPPPGRASPLSGTCAAGAGSATARRRRNRLRLAVTLVAAALVAVAVVGMKVDRTAPSPTVRAVPVAPTTLVPSSDHGARQPGREAGTASYTPTDGWPSPTTQNGWLVAGGGCTNGRCADPMHAPQHRRRANVATVAHGPAVSQVMFDAQTQRDLGGAGAAGVRRSEDGWYGQGGQLWSTHDGGRSWHHLRPRRGGERWTPMGETSWALQARCSTSTTTLPAGQLSCPAVAAQHHLGR